MKYCMFCGQELPEDAGFCFKCGKEQKVEKVAAVEINVNVEAVAPSTVGKTCPYCQFTIKPNEKTVICDQCGIAHHSECWKENDGKCTTFGCSGITKTTNNIAWLDNEERVVKSIFREKNVANESERRQPNNALEYYNRGVALDVNGQVNDAISEYGHAIEVKPDLVNAYVRRGILYYKNKQHELAYEDFRMINKLDYESFLELPWDYKNFYHNNNEKLNHMSIRKKIVEVVGMLTGMLLILLLAGVIILAVGMLH